MEVGPRSPSISYDVLDRDDNGTPQEESGDRPETEDSIMGLGVCPCQVG